MHESVRRIENRRSLITKRRLIYSWRKSTQARARHGRATNLQGHLEQVSRLETSTWPPPEHRSADKWPSSQVEHTDSPCAPKRGNCPLIDTSHHARFISGQLFNAHHSFLFKQRLRLSVWVVCIATGRMNWWCLGAKGARNGSFLLSERNSIHFGTLQNALCKHNVRSVYMRRGVRLHGELRCQWYVRAS